MNKKLQKSGTQVSSPRRPPSGVKVQKFEDQERKPSSALQKAESDIGYDRPSSRIPSPMNRISAIRVDSFSDNDLYAEEQSVNYMFESLLRRYRQHQGPDDYQSSDIERDQIVPQHMASSNSAARL